MAATPPAWGVQYTLSLPDEDAARAAAAELAGMGHCLTAVRVHDHFRFVPSSFWYSRPSMDPELEGWWQVFSLAVYSGHERIALEPFLRSERIRVAQVARGYGGFQQGCGEGHAATLESVFTRDGLVHEQAGAEVTLPFPLLEDPAPPPAGLPWKCGGVGETTEVVQAVVAVAERMYGSAEDAPDAVAWLLDEEFAFGEPYGTTGEFLGDLADAVAHQGTCTDTTVEAIPFLTELVCDDDVAPGSQLVLLCDLLRLAASGPVAAVSLADRITALGGIWEESAAEYLTRRAIGRELPRLWSRRADEGDAVQFALTALTALCGVHGRHALSELAVFPAPGRQLPHRHRGARGSPAQRGPGRLGSCTGPPGFLAAWRCREGSQPERGSSKSGPVYSSGSRPRRRGAGDENGAGSAVIVDSVNHYGWHQRHTTAGEGFQPRRTCPAVVGDHDGDAGHRGRFRDPLLAVSDGVGFRAAQQQDGEVAGLDALGVLPAVGEQVDLCNVQADPAQLLGVTVGVRGDHAQGAVLVEEGGEFGDRAGVVGQVGQGPAHGDQPIAAGAGRGEGARKRASSPVPQATFRARASWASSGRARCPVRMVFSVSLRGRKSRPPRSGGASPVRCAWCSSAAGLPVRG
ncbi:hypothetical protein [Streptomyces sp. NPDC096033]|uniref:hypothetical protein n=1 Tax=Streptomyces sp. NPDC096033 TaxID=3366071 RepID=UPI0037FB0E0C